jgi:hypothetical protein
MIIIYLDSYSAETAGIKELEVQTLNELAGADIPNLQVLKSAAGFYIGTLCKADWHETLWEPYSRDSACYWPTREEAENALRSGNYPVKF